MAQTLGSFRILGVRVRFDASWIILALLIAWTLASGVFPDLHRGLPASTYWAMAAAAVAGVAASIVLHELAHSLAANALGAPVSGITLFVFGGVAEMQSEPRGPLAEFVIAVVGPIMSVALGLGFFTMAGALAPRVGAEVHGVLHYLGVLNMALAAFNMVPAFPLDGGRVLRALIWLFTRDRDRATRIAANSGQFVGVAMITIGVLAALSRELVGGLWWVLLGFFLHSMASAHLHAARARQLLAGARVRDLMTTELVTAPGSISVAEFVDKVLARHPHDLIPVIAEGRVIGAAGFKEVRGLDRARWGETALAEIATPLARIPVADAGADWSEALARLQAAGASRLIAFESGALAGILTLKDLAAHLRFRGEIAAPAPSRNAA